ncbi:hypothetical protein P389DRAFT_190015 [Cystobasidium minutum MCA 4210]|uniref:uncharacterized protein n=1 Tax=Cystobasidium minutum MCA 4210 TaxID=1397322 RepID=UPI0034CF2E12|eukprot:jgi/Rhomi1/190015/estExt_fgenesh1_pg.C_4_t20174
MAAPLLLKLILSQHCLDPGFPAQKYTNCTIDDSRLLFKLSSSDNKTTQSQYGSVALLRVTRTTAHANLTKARNNINGNHPLRTRKDGQETWVTTVTVMVMDGTTTAAAEINIITHMAMVMVITVIADTTIVRDTARLLPLRKHRPKIAMVLLLGPEEREFRLTEAHILFDSPNDLTSTYYASAESADTGDPPKTYRLPDRDGAIFEIIFRYLNREQVLPLRKSMCPTYLSYEQTLAKLAEEAKFYRFMKLQRALPVSTSPSGHSVATLPAPSHYANQVPVHPHPVPPSMSSHHSSPHLAPSPALLPSPLPSQHAHASTPRTPRATHSPRSEPSHHLAPEPSGHHKSHSRSHSPAPSASINSPRPSSRSHSRRSSIVEPKPPPEPEIIVEPEAPPPSLFAYIYRPGQFGIRRGEPEFQLIDYPDDIPVPHLFIRVVNAEIKFSAFRNAHDEEVFELRWSLRVLDEPSTRALAYRVHDSTIKAVDSHLRINGVVGDLSCRDVPLRMRHSFPAQSGRQASIPDYGGSNSDEDGVYTSDLEELLELISSKGYVKWPRIWQDTFDNATPLDSLHQRVCLSSCEVLLDLEFPEDTAEISAEVGGRGFTLDREDEEDLMVRNYRAVLHGIKVETRKMRRLRELDELDPDAKLAKHVSHKLSFEDDDRHARHRRPPHTSSAQDHDRLHASPRPSYHERHASRTSQIRHDTSNRYERSATPASLYEYSDPGSAPFSDTASRLSVPRSYHAATGRPASTASEEIKRRAMQRW